VAATGTKGQAALNNAEEIPYELKLNITDSEIVVVEDTSQWDTNAVILKVTKVLFCDTSITDNLWVQCSCLLLILLTHSLIFL
jgi:hypothetical protein